jgi:epoxyqueuosine reductase
MHGQMTYMEKHLRARWNLNHVLPGAKSVIVVTANYRTTHPESDAKFANYALGLDYHTVIKSRLRNAEKLWVELLPDAHFRPCVDSVPIPEREYAHRAGLGWFGKNTCLIDSVRGSWFFIALCLTTAELEPDQPSVGGCGSCRACIDACPTGAIVQLNGRWTVDARRCVSYLTIEKRGAFSPSESEMIGEWTYGCDICQEVCPFNQPRGTQPLRAIDTTWPEFQPRPIPGLAELSVIDDAEFETRFGPTAVERTGPEGLRRNALANIQNRTKTRVQE